LSFKCDKFEIEKDIQVFDSEFQGGHLFPLTYIAGANILETRAN